MKSLFSLQQVELNGALSNPRLAVELRDLAPLRERLLGSAACNPRRSRPAPGRKLPILDTVKAVLQFAGQPMTIADVHAAAEALLGEPLPRKPIKAALSAGAIGGNHRFRRVRRGVYEAKHAQAAGNVARPRSQSPAISGVELESLSRRCRAPRRIPRRWRRRLRSHNFGVDGFRGSSAGLSATWM